MKRLPRATPMDALDGYKDDLDPHYHPDWCECERCIRELMSNHDSSNRKGNDFLRAIMEYDGVRD